MIQPWEKSPLEVTIVESYEAETIGQHGKYYLIEFADVDGGIVEAKLPRKRFRHFPYPVRVGTYFGIIVYKEGGKTKAGTWPVPMYWNPELRGN
jgi:hypothetical protein